MERDKILEKFENNLLNESHNNENGLLVCEIDVFRKYAKKALDEQRKEAIKIVKNHWITKNPLCEQNVLLNVIIKQLEK